MSLARWPVLCWCVGGGMRRRSAGPHRDSAGRDQRCLASVVIIVQVDMLSNALVLLALQVAAAEIRKLLICTGSFLSSKKNVGCVIASKI